METLRNWKVICLAIVIVVSTALAGRMAFADEPPPAEVQMSDKWMDENVPTIRELKARLAVLEAEKNKRINVFNEFGYDYNWDTLTPVKRPLQ